ncbi:hypothetical protein OPW41_14340 [Vibrio europaeus]|uniref:Uncharacterized protein n=2 Tax=Vibrio europaeus TaxID=300876 RepID=A0ABT5GTR8_9VIBR|nr:hypothetical protein [Vibrio europaeus]MDC5703459.1 hypothetical protein [Vibrio europaeus]MDC5711386.1 hypothetical protein [Vibrio europaeus]MDC5714879.1 hypothetical protein [Vibrio europaeus]MDC5727497.1 hypothetical protein [Vibrio europaeus]MDC5729726.1 hypothetical protein [Vibrio europaeus]
MTATVTGTIHNPFYTFVTIGQSKGGEQRLYISMATPKSSNGTLLINDPEEAESILGPVWKINNKNVKMNIYLAGNGEVIEATPLTSSGHDYLVGQFKRLKYVTVTFHSNNSKVKFSAENFVNEWNMAGGDAI